jgi:ribosomal protein L20A (L18A)
MVLQIGGLSLRHQAPVPFSDIAAGHREDRTRIRIGNVVHIRRLRAA